MCVYIYIHGTYIYIYIHIYIYIFVEGAIYIYDLFLGLTQLTLYNRNRTPTYRCDSNSIVIAYVHIITDILYITNSYLHSWLYMM